VHNAGVPGDTAALPTREFARRPQTRPALVIVEIGGNDFLRRRPEAAVKEDLRAIVGAIRQSGSQVVLVAVPRLSLLGAVSGRLPDSKSTPSWPKKKSCRWSKAFSPPFSPTRR
jgi:acyl-CoA thioesterase-1